MAKSILTEYEDISAFSGKPTECWHHLVEGRGLRKLSDRFKLLLPLTNEEHNCSSRGLIYQIHENPAAEHLSKMLGQVAFEKEYYREMAKVDGDPAREQFRKVFGQSFL